MVQGIILGETNLTDKKIIKEEEKAQKDIGK
jgi:hypothetical protein